LTNLNADKYGKLATQVATESSAQTLLAETAKMKSDCNYISADSFRRDVGAVISAGGLKGNEASI
jgi:hypothetical protein